MKTNQKISITFIALFIVCLCILPLSVIWFSNWSWFEQSRILYIKTIFIIYAALGVFLIAASLNSLTFRNLIWIGILPCLSHGSVMAFQIFT